jgi:hypothetical protein
VPRQGLVRPEKGVCDVCVHKQANSVRGYLGVPCVATCCCREHTKRKVWPEYPPLRIKFGVLWSRTPSVTRRGAQWQNTRHCRFFSPVVNCSTVSPLCRCGASLHVLQSRTNPTRFKIHSDPVLNFEMEVERSRKVCVDHVRPDQRIDACHLATPSHLVVPRIIARNGFFLRAH